jgi:hypothetical protein
VTDSSMTDPPEKQLFLYQRLQGEQRDAFIRWIKKLYEKEGLSIRDIVRVTGRSYGSIHGLLVAENISRRPQGGSRGRRR